MGCKVQCMRVGSVAFVSTPGEPFTKTAQQVAAASPFEHTLFFGYSNGGFGYGPTRQAFQEGGYEVDARLSLPARRKRWRRNGCLC